MRTPCAVEPTTDLGHAFDQALVRTAGLEPARGFPQGILSPLRLPFRHVRAAHPKAVRAAALVAPAARASKRGVHDSRPLYNPAPLIGGWKASPVSQGK